MREFICHNPKIGYCPKKGEYRDKSGKLNLAKYAKDHPNLDPEGPELWAWDGERPRPHGAS